MKKIIKEEYLGIDCDICGLGEEAEMFRVAYNDGTDAIEYREPAWAFQSRRTIDLQPSKV